MPTKPTTPPKPVWNALTTFAAGHAGDQAEEQGGERQRDEGMDAQPGDQDDQPNDGDQRVQRQKDVVA